MRRNLRFIWMLFKLKLSHSMVFRLAFFGAFFADGILFIIQLLVFSAIYGNVDMIGSWNQAQMIIFIGTFSLINAISMVLVFFGINDLPRKIKSGSLDHYLTKPISPLLRLTFESIDLGHLWNPHVIPNNLDHIDIIAPSFIDEGEEFSIKIIGVDKFFNRVKLNKDLKIILEEKTLKILETVHKDGVYNLKIRPEKPFKVKTMRTKLEKLQIWN